jgi:predicted ATP-dependent serine protease
VTTPGKSARYTGYAGAVGSQVQTLAEIATTEIPRFSSGFKELDRVLGGGVVPGSAILIGGNPGAGKSTLLLQTMCGLAQRMKTLYVTGIASTLAGCRHPQSHLGDGVPLLALAALTLPAGEVGSTFGTNIGGFVFGHG